MSTPRLKDACTARRAAIFACAVALGACGKTPTQDTQDSLARDPDRLKAVQLACRDDPKLSNDKLCRDAAVAYRQRFFDRKSVEPNAPTAKAPPDETTAPKF